MIDIESPDPSWPSYQSDLLLVLKLIRYINGQIHIWTILVLTVRGLLGESYLINTTIGPICTYETVFCHRFSSNCFQSFQNSHLSQLSDFDEIVYTTEPSMSSQKSLFLSPSFPKRWGPTGSSADRRHLQYYSNLLKQQKTKQTFCFAYSC